MRLSLPSVAALAVALAAAGLAAQCPQATCSTTRALAVYPGTTPTGGRSFTVSISLAPHLGSGIPCADGVAVYAVDGALRQRLFTGPQFSGCNSAVWPGGRPRTFTFGFAEAALSANFTTYTLQVVVDPGNCRTVDCPAFARGPFHRLPSPPPIPITLYGSIGTNANTAALDASAVSASQVTIAVGASSPGAGGALLFAAAPALLPWLGGELFVDPAQVIGSVSCTTNALGIAQVPVPIPPGFTASVYVQALVLAAGSSTSIEMSNGLQLN